MTLILSTIGLEKNAIFLDEKKGVPVAIFIEQFDDSICPR